MKNDLNMKIVFFKKQQKGLIKFILIRMITYRQSKINILFTFYHPAEFFFFISLGRQGAISMELGVNSDRSSCQLGIIHLYCTNFVKKNKNQDLKIISMWQSIANTNVII